MQGVYFSIFENKSYILSSLINVEPFYGALLLFAHLFCFCTKFSLRAGDVALGPMQWD